MIKREMVLNYYNYGEQYFGSYHGMRYALVKAGDKDEPKLRATIWAEPFCFDVTPDDQKTIEEFGFSEEEYAKAITWLNHQYESIYKNQ